MPKETDKPRAALLVSMNDKIKDAVAGLDAPVMMAVKELKSYDDNAKIHTDKTRAALLASMNEFGFVNPIIADDVGVIICGHGRVAAAKDAGMREIPVVIVRGWSEIKKRQFRLLDNRASDISTWNETMLESSLAALADMDFNFDSIGFEPFAGGADKELTEKEITQPTITQPGDIYILGRHVLICGDATDAAVAKQVLEFGIDDDRCPVSRETIELGPRLMVTDPPYGVNYDDSWRVDVGKQKKAQGKIAGDDEIDWAAAYRHFTGPTSCVWHSTLHAAPLADSLIKCGFGIEAEIVWIKPWLILGRGWMHWRTEHMLIVGRPPRDKKLKAIFTAESERDCWEIARNAINTGHATVKPIECMARPIRNHSLPNDLIYDPFVGSGTTIIAAECEGRSCRAIEIDPKHCDLAVRRWDEYSECESVRVPFKK